MKKNCKEHLWVNITPKDSGPKTIYLCMKCGITKVEVAQPQKKNKIEL